MVGTSEDSARAQFAKLVVWDKEVEIKMIQYTPDTKQHIETEPSQHLSTETVESTT